MDGGRTEEAGRRGQEGSGGRMEELKERMLGEGKVKLEEVIREICRWRVDSGGICGISVEDFTEFYLAGRERNTIAGYEGAFKWVRSFGQQCGRVVWDWGEGEVAGLVVKLTKERKGENLMKKCSAVVNLVNEAMGKEAPTKSGALKMVKKTAVKTMNKEKRRKMDKKPMTVEDMARMIKEIFLESRKVDFKSKQILALMTMLFFGVKRFGDVQKIKVRDVVFKEDGGVEVWMRVCKTDVQGRGKVFRMSGSRTGGVSVAKILRWYVRSLGLRQEDYFFCKIGRKSEVLGSDFIKYQEARASFDREQEYLGIRGLTLHSGRVGAATEASEEGVSRDNIKKAGDWRSEAVDVYIKSKDQGKEVSRALVRALRF